MQTVDLAQGGVRALNERLHKLPRNTNERAWRIVNPRGAHAVAVGLNLPVEVHIDGHVGYYCAGMNKEATVVVHGQCGWGLGENIMSGLVRVTGNASQAAGASGHGGMVVVEGDAGPRCGIAMKGVDIVVGGSVGNFSAFMAQAGNLVVCGDAGEALGDSIYEASLYVRGEVKSLGADCVEKKMTPKDVKTVAALLAKAGIKADAARFRRYGSARKLYNFNVDHADAY
jgi:glutamate synthase domain-containing protein 3